MRAFIRKPLVLKILSLLIAIFIWIYVINIENPEVDYDLKAVNITVVTKNTTPYKNGLIITEGLSQTIDIKVKGRHNALSSYDFKNITATVDINTVTTEGDYSLPVKVTVPGSDVWLVSYTPNKLKFTFSKTQTLNIPIKVIVDGTLPNNYSIDTAKSDPISVNVTGPTKEVESISHAAVNINVDNLTRSEKKESFITLVSKDNKELKSNNITLSSNKASIDIALLKKIDIPLTVQTVGTYSGSTTNVVLIDIFPKTVQVIGKPEIVDLIKNINLGTFDITNVIDNQQRSFDIIVPNTVKRQSSETSALVTIKIAEPQTKTVSAVTIDTSSLDLSKLGTHTVTLSKKQIDITVSGVAPDISNVTANDIMAKADFSELKLTNGVQEIPVIVSVNSYKNIKIIGQYSVTVEVK